MVLRSDDPPPTRGPDGVYECATSTPATTHYLHLHNRTTMGCHRHPRLGIINYIQLHESPTVQLQTPQHSYQMTTDVQTATRPNINPTTRQQQQSAARQNATPIILQNSSVSRPSYSAPRVPVNIQLPQYDGTTSVVQWWMSFMAYVQLYRMDDHQAINIIPFCLSHMIKHWFLNLDLNIKVRSQWKKAFFTRFKNQETTDEDIENNS